MACVAIASPCRRAVAGPVAGLDDEHRDLEHRDVARRAHIPSGHASVLAYTMPLWVALIGFVVFRQRLTGRLLLALAIGAAAVAALMIPNFQSYASAPLGLFWGLSPASAGRSALSS